jgi:hypothetical protein
VKDQIDSAGSQAKIFKVALPVSLEAVFQTLLGFVDQIIVGTPGATAVAAVGLCNSISFIVMLLYSAIGTGAGVLVAQAFGRNDLNGVSKVASLSLMLSGIFGVLTALPLVLYPGPVLRLIGAPDELVEAGSAYFQLFSGAAPLIVMSAVTTATFRSLNDSTTIRSFELPGTWYSVNHWFRVVVGWMNAPFVSACSETRRKNSIEPLGSIRTLQKSSDVPPRRTSMMPLPSGANWPSSSRTGYSQNTIMGALA